MKKTVFLSKEPEPLRMNESIAGKNIAVYCPRCESCDATFVDPGLEGNRVQCTGSCGIVPLSQYVSNATDLVEVKVFTQERIPFLMANTHNLNLNRTPSHNFAKFMDAAPFPWNNSYKGNFDDYLFYYS